MGLHQIISRTSGGAEHWTDAPVENILYTDREVGWRAGEPGPQIIQITFGGPTNIRHIQLLFRDFQIARTQEFTLRSSVAAGERKEVIPKPLTGTAILLLLPLLLVLGSPHRGAARRAPL